MRGLEGVLFDRFTDQPGFELMATISFLNLANVSEDCIFLWPLFIPIPRVATFIGSLVQLANHNLTYLAAAM